MARSRLGRGCLSQWLRIGSGFLTSRGFVLRGLELLRFQGILLSFGEVVIEFEGP